MGPAHPRFKDGRHSKWLPKDLSARYQDATKDPDLVGVRSEIALVDVRVGQLLESIGETGNTKLLKEIRAKFDVFKAAGKKRGKNSAVEGLGALEHVDRLIDRAMEAAATWEELRETLELRRKLSETETRRLRDLHQSISVERALALMAMLVDEVRKHVTDRTALAAIAAQFVRLTGRRSGEVIDA